MKSTHHHIIDIASWPDNLESVWYTQINSKAVGLMTLGYIIHQISQCATLHFYHSLFAFSFCPIFLLACLNLEEQRSPTVSEIKMEHLKPFSQTPSQATKRCFWERDSEFSRACKK